MAGSGGIERLPEDCIAHAVSLTSPRDACCTSAVCTAFRSAVASNTVWDRFLPPDCQSLLSRAVHPVEESSSSKRDLFFRLCDSVLIDGGKMSFWLERRSGTKCFMLSARQLSIVWGDTPRYWRWVSLPDSRFSEVAELIDVCWLEIRGKIKSKLLSPKTTYAAYLIFKLADWSRGLGYPPQEASVTLGLHSSTNVVRLQPRDTASATRNRIRFGPLIMWHRMMMSSGATARAEEGGGLPWAREDGWMEAYMGEFYNEGEGEVEVGEEVVMSLMEVKGGHWKNGLIIEGIEIRLK